MDKHQNTSKIDTVGLNKPALVTDLNDSYVSNQQYNYARNATRNSSEGDLGTIGNEPSNELCFSAPYKVIGHIPLLDDTFLIFSTDNTNSEIGLGDASKCTYTTLKNLPCLNFNDNYPITGVMKNDFQKGIIVTFTDKYNPVRRIELKKLPTIDNCEDILLFKMIDQPCITLTKGQVGNMPNGSYSVAVAYVVNNEVFSDYFSLTERIQLYSETGSNSIDIKISGLDSEFEEFTVVVVGTFIDPETKGATKQARRIGNFSTRTSSVSVTDFLNPNYLNVPISTLVTKKRSWEKAGIISSNSNYLILGDLVSRPEENYQLKAMSIQTEYVVDQVPLDYYENNGLDVGYYRDENYDFYIEGIYRTGESTDKFHIGGRQATALDLASASSEDVYEHDTQFADCEQPGKVPRWKVENTAGTMIPISSDFVCNRRTIGYGKMGYFQSTDKYPDNKDMFGESANQPIRYHKFPDECKVPRYTIIDGKVYINILGVRFKNIAPFNNPDIVGYRITRSDRKGGNGTVVARGIMTNVRSYVDDKLKQTILYSNYAVNDLSPDQYLSSTQTVFKNGKETSFTPLTDYHTDKFSFYSPHTLFEPRYSLGTELKIESEEVAEVTGQFEIVHNHPKAKLMNQFSFWLAAAVGFIESTLILIGKNSYTYNKQAKISAEGVSSGTSDTFETGDNIEIKSVADLVGLDIVSFVTKRILSRDPLTIVKIKDILLAIAALGIKIPYSIFGGIKAAEDIFQIMQDFTGYTNYVYQCNSHAFFNRSICQKNGQKRRRLTKPALYIPPTVLSIDDKVYNNFNRERCVYLELNKPLSEPFIKDTSRNTISGYNICDNINQQFKAAGSAYYVTSKVPNPNQYGQLGSSNPVSMHSCVLSGTDTPTLFGGDCVIAKFSFQRKMPFFSQNLANTNYPDSVEYDYRKYRNIAYPRYWIDSTKYDFSELLSKNVINYSRFSRTTTSKHNLDCKKGDKKNILRVDDAYMYLSNNCVLEYIVECDYNINFREKTSVQHYSKTNTNLSQIFRSDRLVDQEEFVINRAYSDLYPVEISTRQQRYDFNPADPLPVNQYNSVIYSLPSFNLQEVDNWQYFLPGNYFAFRESDFGRLTSIHKVDQDRLVYLFSDSSPFMSMGRDILELEGSGRKITVGDGGLFAQDPREMVPTDNNYGACNSKYAFSNTHLGRFYPSERQGRIISLEQMDDITRQGISYWCKMYMPIFLYKHFPEYPQVENPISGVGYLTVFDSATETVYITKRDFSPKKEYVDDITFDSATGKFSYKGNNITLRSNYFNDISWTLSYSPLDRGFVSWHDWHPDWVIQRDNHFLTVKDNKVYKHNERTDSFCVFYGVEYPFEIGVLSSSGQQVETLRSLEYLLEVYHYKNFGRDRFHVHGENFSHLIVKNSEQISPLLHLVKASGDPEADLVYPRINSANPVMYDVLFSKEENKYRINQFWDAVKDRGEFSTAESHIHPVDESGYKRVINPVAIDINKPEEQRKKFRHYWNQFILIKDKSGANKFLFKLINIKKLISPR